MVSKVLEAILTIMAVSTVALIAGFFTITIRYRREIYRAEKHRAKEILLRTRTIKDAEPNLSEDKHPAGVA